ncbi:MAG: hypothetical protein MJ066_06185 [Clostridia bacterium]|nr:hypothetical protein [Clostridia bacterium]
MLKIEELQAFFKNVDKDKRQFAFDTIDEYVFFVKKLEELKEYPLIEVSNKKPAMQRVTAAGKLIKDYSQVIDAKRGTLLRILSGIESTDADKLREMFKEFEND